MGRALGAFRGEGTGASEPCERQQRVREGVVTCGEQDGGQRATQPARGTGERARARRELETSARRCDVSTCVSPSAADLSAAWHEGTYRSRRVLSGPVWSHSQIPARVRAEPRWRHPMPNVIAQDISCDVRASSDVGRSSDTTVDKFTRTEHRTPHVSKTVLRDCARSPHSSPGTRTPQNGLVGLLDGSARRVSRRRALW